MNSNGVNRLQLDFHRNPRVLAEIVDAMPVGVFTVDAEGRFVAWNAGAERITGYGRDEVIGQPCRLLEGPNCKGFAKITDLLRSPDPHDDGICNQECKILARSGNEVYIHGSVRVLRNDDGQVIGAVGSFMDVSSLVRANEKIAALEARTGQPTRFGELLGRSPAMREVFRKLRLAADSDVTVLITGESGTGKELAARAIHSHSDRAKRPFVAINCSAIPDSLLESELFGYRRGAFTDAREDRPGLFEAADGGTLFLDEIGDVSPAVQVRLLRVLQEREVRRIGDHRVRKVNVRLITATNRDLQQLVAEGKVREDFYYRIHVFEIRMPPLRERKEDIPLLVSQMIERICAGRKQAVDAIARDALEVLQSYDWPGNVRQLQNAIEHACVTATGDRITALDLPPEIRHPDTATAAGGSRWSPEELAERDRIVAVLQQHDWNRTRAAEALGVSRVTLWKKMSKFKIQPPK